MNKRNNKWKGNIVFFIIGAIWIILSIFPFLISSSKGTMDDRGSVLTSIVKFTANFDVIIGVVMIFIGIGFIVYGLVKVKGK